MSNFIIPKILLQKIPNLYETENQSNPICYIKLFTPDANFTWYITEFCKEDNNTCFGYVEGLDSELGYFTLQELELIKGSLGLGVELDTSFKPTPLSNVKQKDRRK